MLVDLRTYKVAKNFIKDAKSFMKSIDGALKTLHPFSHYKPVSNIIAELRNNKSILLAHLSTAEKIVKGEK